jgi:hypothetical protein
MVSLGGFKCSDNIYPNSNPFLGKSAAVLPLLFLCSEVPSLISEVPTVWATVSRGFRVWKF